MARSLDTKRPRPYVCTSPGCGRAFRSSSDRLRHEQIHLPAELRTYFVCTYQHCSKRYTQKRALQNHINYVHFGLKKRCRVEACNALLVDDSSLWHHEQKMHRHMLFPCDFCGYLLHTEKSLKFHLLRCEERSQSPTPSSTVLATGGPDATTPDLSNDPCHSDDGRIPSVATSMSGPSVSSPSSQRLWDYDPPSWSPQWIDSPSASPFSDLALMLPAPDGWLDFFLTHPLLGAHPDSATPEGNAPPSVASQIPPVNSVEFSALSPPSFSPFLEAPPQPKLLASPSPPIYYPHSKPEAPLPQPRHEQMPLSQVGSFSPVSAPSRLASINDRNSNASRDISVSVPVPVSNPGPGSLSSMLALDLAEIASLFESSNPSNWEVESNHTATLPPNVTGGAFADSLRWPTSSYDEMTLNSAWFNSLC